LWEVDDYASSRDAATVEVPLFANQLSLPSSLGSPPGYRLSEPDTALASPYKAERENRVSGDIRPCDAPANLLYGIRPW